MYIITEKNDVVKTLPGSDKSRCWNFDVITQLDTLLTLACEKTRISNYIRATVTSIKGSESNLIELRDSIIKAFSI